MHAIGALAQHLWPDCAGMMEGWGAEVRAVREPPLRGRGMARMDVALGMAGYETCPYGGEGWIHGAVHLRPAYAGMTGEGG